MPLTDLTPVSGASSINLRSVTMGRKSYEQAMTMEYPCESNRIQFSINERYKTLTFTVGLDDNGIADLFTATVKGDDRTLKTTGVEINRPQNVTVDVTGVVQLEIWLEGECADGGSESVLALADATLHS